ncbi:MAG: enoyl-CoA hydratase/isomerase family protein [Solirubrobacterales bacterium]
MPGEIALEEVDGITVVRLQRPPANAPAPEFLAEGAAMMEDLRIDPPAAIVLTGSRGFFSGGVDLKLAPTLSPGEQTEMVAGINRLFIDWYGFPRPVVAAVNGHAVAGGMILALCADRRIGAADATYGLTELRVGIGYPAAAIGCVRAELTPWAMRRTVLDADLLGSEVALERGLVDEVVAADEVFDRSLAVAKDLGALPAHTYETVKEQVRGPALAAMRSGAAKDPMSQGWLDD